MNWVGWSGSITPCQSLAEIGATERKTAPSAINHLRVISPAPPARLGARSLLHLALPVSCVLEVCGAFGGRVVGEDFSACVGDRLVASRFGLSQQSLELGEDLLDRVEVGGVFGQEDEAGSDSSDGLPHLLPLVGAEIVEDHSVARLEGRDEELLDIGAEAFAVDRAVEQAGRIDAVIAKRARNVAVFHLPCGTLSTRRSPFGAQPRSRVMLVLVHVSSMKIRRLGSMRP